MYLEPQGLGLFGVPSRSSCLPRRSLLWSACSDYGSMIVTFNSRVSESVFRMSGRLYTLRHAEDRARKVYDWLKGFGGHQLNLGHLCI